VLPLLLRVIEDAGFLCSVNHGGLSLQARNAAQRAFRGGETNIFLTSDAGSKGINLPEATYMLHYERPPLHSLFVQRSDRIHRIDSLKEAVYIYSLVARGTIEEGLYSLNLRRNEWNDKLIDSDASESDFISSADRKALLKIGRIAS
jgi:SNF2 family DNA or RNA helicase